MIKPCETCGKDFKSKPCRKRRFCSKQCVWKSPNHPLLSKDRKFFSELRQKQLVHEEAEAEKLRQAGYEVFSPTVVCDRVAIKDGKVFFVEFKSTGQNLRAGQQRVHDTSPDNYLIVYSEK